MRSASSSTSAANAAKVELLALGEVEEAAGRADDDLHALRQRVGLRLVGDSAVDRDDADAARAAGGLDVASDLDAELAGRHDDECLRTAVRTLGRGEHPL